jgi:hypothetical protein
VGSTPLSWPLGGLALLAITRLVPACGYQAVYATHAERLHVKLVRVAIADAVAPDEVASGVREELARAGALDVGESYPRVEIEVLRADETSEGIAAGATGPVARGTDVAVVARAWIARGPDAQPEADTGDMRAEETIATDATAGGIPGAQASSFHHADAVRAAARRLGHELAARIMGLPAASQDVGE